MSDLAIGNNGLGDFVTDTIGKGIATVVGGTGAAIMGTGAAARDAYSNYLDAGQTAYLSSMEEGQKQLDNLRLFHAYQKKFARELEVKDTAAFSKFFATEAGKTKLTQLGIIISGDRLIAEVKAGNYTNIPQSIRDNSILKTDTPIDDSDLPSGLSNGQVNQLRREAYEEGRGSVPPPEPPKGPNWTTVLLIALGAAASGLVGGWGITQLTQVSSLSSALGAKDKVIAGKDTEIATLNKQIKDNTTYYEGQLQTKADELGLKIQDNNKNSAKKNINLLKAAPASLVINTPGGMKSLPKDLQDFIIVMGTKSKEFEGRIGSTDFAYNSPIDAMEAQSVSLLTEFRARVQLYYTTLSPFKELYTKGAAEQNINAIKGADVVEKINNLPNTIPMLKVDNFYMVPIYLTDDDKTAAKAGNLIPIETLKKSVADLEKARTQA
jgi:hypothetical protein